jgi:hypothetical protein
MWIFSHSTITSVLRMEDKFGWGISTWNSILFLSFKIFSLISKVYGKILLWLNSKKSSYITLETCNQKINSGFKCSYLFEISVLLPIVLEIVLFHFLYFFRLRKYENRIRRKILGGDMVGSQKPKGTLLWWKLHKTVPGWKYSPIRPYELIITKKSFWTLSTLRTYTD